MKTYRLLASVLLTAAGITMQAQQTDDLLVQPVDSVSAVTESVQEEVTTENECSGNLTREVSLLGDAATGAGLFAPVKYTPDAFSFDTYDPSLSAGSYDSFSSDCFGEIGSGSVEGAPGSVTTKTYKNWLGETCIDFGDNSKNYYNWQRDITYSGIPVFLSSFIIKARKTAFRSARFSIYNGWKSEIDNYTQFSPYALVVALKALGYQGRSSWDRMLVSAVMSNLVMATIVNSTKYSVKELRPDNSTRNSFPSGHTATAFAAATVLHKEYGLTRSPWFSIGGYAVAMATGYMRVLNNRHWISDVMAGAGIGIMSTELGYFLTDLIYRNKGICRTELTSSGKEKPSFFDVQMGIGVHSNTMVAEYESGAKEQYKLGTSTVVGVEGAYFFNKYVGIGGMLRMTTTPTQGLQLSAETQNNLRELERTLSDYDLPCIYNVNMSNSNLIDASYDLGVYGNLPIGKRFSVGLKVLAGARISGGYEYKARAGYRTLARDENGDAILTGSFVGDGVYNWSWVYLFENADGSTFASNETLMPGVSANYNYHLDPNLYLSDEYTISKLSGSTSLNCVVGASFTYRYKQNLSWKLFFDWDMSKNSYKYKFDLFDKATVDFMKRKIDFLNPTDGEIARDIVNEADAKGHVSDSFKSPFNLFTIGGSFSVHF